jgi:hypothetical protein
MANDDYDPVMMGKVLARLEAQDRVLASLQEDMEELMENMHRKDGMHKILLGLISVLSFVIGNAINYYIFRGPGHP